MAGRDGRDGVDGAKGEKGERGAPGPSQGELVYVQYALR